MTGHELEAYNLVEKLCREISVSGLIFSNKTIKNYLLETSKNKILNKKYKEITQNFQYSNEYRKASNYTPSENIFLLPNSPSRVVCLVTGILFEFDRGTLSLNKFLKDFFKSESIGDSFNIFCSKIISPYVYSIKKIIEGYEEELSEDEKIKEDKKNYKTVPELLIEQIMPLIISIKDLVKTDNQLLEELRKDLLEIIDAFIYSLDRFSTAVISPLFISLKRLLPLKKEYQKHISTINDMFLQYGILN